MALTADHLRLYRNQLADLKFAASFAQGSHLCGNLVPQCDGIGCKGMLPVINMDITAADADFQYFSKSCPCPG